jgi:hypothetical protein
VSCGRSAIDSVSASSTRGAVKWMNSSGPPQPAHHRDRRFGRRCGYRLSVADVGHRLPQPLRSGGETQVAAVTART